MSGTRRKVLFVCVHNAGRSRAAAAFLSRLAGDRYEAVSAGTEPARQAHPEVVEGMKRRGIDVVDGPGVMLTRQLAEDATRVISMGCNVEEACPALTSPMEDWDLQDPKGRSKEEVDRILSQIEMRVEGLVSELDAEVGGA